MFCALIVQGATLANKIFIYCNLVIEHLYFNRFFFPKLVYSKTSLLYLNGSIKYLFNKHLSFNIWMPLQMFSVAELICKSNHSIKININTISAIICLSKYHPLIIYLALLLKFQVFPCFYYSKVLSFWLQSTTMWLDYYIQHESKKYTIRKYWTYFFLMFPCFYLGFL